MNRFITMQCEFLFSFLVPPSVGYYSVFVLVFLLEDKVDALDWIYVILGKAKISTDRLYL